MLSAEHDCQSQAKEKLFRDYFPHPEFHSPSNATAAVRTPITHHIGTSREHTGLAPFCSSHIAPRQLRGITWNAGVSKAPEGKAMLAVNFWKFHMASFLKASNHKLLGGSE